MPPESESTTLTASGSRRALPKSTAVYRRADPERPRYNIIFGSDSTDSPQYGILGKTIGDRARTVALDLNATNTIAMFGNQGSGKSYSLGNIIEMGSQRLPHLNCLPKPACTIVFHYSRSPDYRPEWLTMRHPNINEDDLEALSSEYSAAPQGVEDLIVLTPAQVLDRCREEFPGVEVHPLVFGPDEVSIESWRNLMSSTASDSSETEVLMDIMSEYRHELSVARLMGLVEADELLSEEQKKRCKLALRKAGLFIQEGASIARFIKPGRIIVVDMRDEFLTKSLAFKVFLVLLQVASGVLHEGVRFPKFLVADELHNYVKDPFLIERLVELIRLMRHKAMTILLASQDPIRLDEVIIELASMLILLGMDSPKWLAHIKSVKSTLENVHMHNLVELEAGQAYVWCRKCSEQQYTREAALMQLRRRATMHGGGTKTAVDTPI